MSLMHTWLTTKTSAMVDLEISRMSLRFMLRIYWMSFNSFTHYIQTFTHYTHYGITCIISLYIKYTSSNAANALWFACLHFRICGYTNQIIGWLHTDYMNCIWHSNHKQIHCLTKYRCLAAADKMHIATKVLAILDLGFYLHQQTGGNVYCYEISKQVRHWFTIVYCLN